jgi:PAS domain S-box-containing protein
MKQLFGYLNPVARLGYNKYSIAFPFLATLMLAVVSEVFSIGILHNPDAVGAYIIFIHVAFIIYFAFRDGIRGGMLSTALAIVYYLYIVWSRHHQGDRLLQDLETILWLSALYIFIGWTIGSLKIRIDHLIEREADEKRRLEAIVQQLPIGIVITDKGGSVTYANKKVEELLGVSLPAGYIVGRETLLKTTYRGKEVTPEKGPLAIALSTGKSVVGQEVVVTRKDGRQVYLRTNAGVIRNKKGHVIAAASITNDITQQKEHEKRKDDFINMASHELKTPITSMVLYLETLMRKLEDVDDKQIASIVDRIKFQTEKLYDLVTDLLDVSRIQTGKLALTREQFDLTKLLTETVSDIQDTTTTHTITFSSKTVVSVNADKFRIYQVITNLLTNAIKYSPEGKKIIVTLQKANGTATIRVKDAGIGVSKEQQKKIFERLYQVPEHDEVTYPGLGLGLYISQQIVKRHRGKIWVESVKGNGSTFAFTLPTVSPSIRKSPVLQ